MRKLFDADPVRRRKTIFHYEDNTPGDNDSKDKIIFETKQEVSPIIDYNVAKQNAHTGRWGDIAHVARIDHNTWQELERIGIAYDDDALDKWLDDSDHRKFRTKLGRLS